MSELVQALRKHGEANKGSDLGGCIARRYLIHS